MSTAPKTVLIIDDDPIYRELMRSFLKSKGNIETLEASDGAKAGRLIASNPALSLILCDLNMPDVNGVELMQRLVDTRSRVPVVVVTGALESTVNGAMALARVNGVNVLGYCRKPFDRRAVWELAGRVLSS